MSERGEPVGQGVVVVDLGVDLLEAVDGLLPAHREVGLLPALEEGLPLLFVARKAGAVNRVAWLHEQTGDGRRDHDSGPVALREFDHQAQVLPQEREPEGVLLVRLDERKSVVAGEESLEHLLRHGQLLAEPAPDPVHHPQAPREPPDLLLCRDESLGVEKDLLEELVVAQVDDVEVRLEGRRLAHHQVDAMGSGRRHAAVQDLDGAVGELAPQSVREHHGEGDVGAHAHRR